MTQSFIVAHTIEITYKGTTRPINFVYNKSFGLNMDSHFMALTLWSFRDMIPDYQDYVEMPLPFNYKLDNQAELILPVKKYTYCVETLGHGEIKGTFTNKSLRRYFPSHTIIERICFELGIKKELIKLVDHEGVEVKEKIYADHPNITLFAVFESLETKMAEKGIETLTYRSTLRSGETMCLYKANTTDQLYDLDLIQFVESSDFRITRRTNKQVVIKRGVETYRKNIKTAPWGEYVKIDRRCLVMKDDSVKLNTPYVCPS